MKTPTKAAMSNLLVELRALAGNRPLTYGQSIHAARIQAAHYRAWAGGSEPAINLIGLIKQRLIPVNLVPSYRLHGDSGLATNAVDGHLQIFVNCNEPDVRQRFSLLHEFKHAIDFEQAASLHAKLGLGNNRLQKDMIEWIANEFAAHVLMPTGLVKRIWFSTQDVSLMASLFHVSAEAMTTRLEKLGLIGEPKPAPTVYFRRESGLMSGLESELELELDSLAA